MKDDAEVIEDKPTYTSPSFIDIPEEDREKETEEERTLRTSPRVVETNEKKQLSSPVPRRPITARFSHKMLWLWFCPPKNPLFRADLIESMICRDKGGIKAKTLSRWTGWGGSQ